MDLVIALLIIALGVLAYVLGNMSKKGYALALVVLSVAVAVVVRHVFDGVSLGLIVSQGVGLVLGHLNEIRYRIEMAMHVHEDVLNQLNYTGNDEPTIPLDGAR